MPTFTVHTMDFYSITDSEKRLDLLGRLRDLSQCQQDELTDSTLSSLLWSAAQMFNHDTGTWNDIVPLHEHAIVLWAAINVCDMRMNASSKYFPITSRVGKTDPSHRVAMNMQIKQDLRKQYEQYIKDAGIEVGESVIVQGELMRRSMATERMEPDDTVPFPPKTVTQILAIAQTTADIAWVYNKAFRSFANYVIYIDTKPLLADPTRQTADTKPGVRSDVQIAATIDKQHLTAARLTGLAPATDYWISVATQDINSNVTLSDEIHIRTQA